jgi:hypothetical protein
MAIPEIFVVYRVNKKGQELLFLQKKIEIGFL